MQKLGEPVDVVRLERGDVPLEQLAGLVVELAGRGDVCGSERRACALQRTVDRGDARLEQLRRLARLPLQDLAEDERGPLLRRQVLQRCDEGEPQRLALLRELVRRGNGVIQVTSGSSARFSNSGSCAGPRSIGRARRSRPASASKQRSSRSGTATT